MLLFPKCSSDLARTAFKKYIAFIHHKSFISIRNDVLQTMFCNDHCRSNVTIDFFYRFQEIRCRDRIKLGSRFIQNQKRRMHCHDRCQIEELFLTPGQFFHSFVKPLVNSKITRHFCYPKTDRSIIISKALQTKAEFMPDFVRHNLVVRILHNKADFLTLRPMIDFSESFSFVQDFSRCCAMRHKYTFEMTKKCAFSASASPTDDI